MYCPPPWDIHSARSYVGQVSQGASLAGQTLAACPSALVVASALRRVYQVRERESASVAVACTLRVYSAGVPRCLPPHANHESRARGTASSHRSCLDLHAAPRRPNPASLRPSRYMPRVTCRQKQVLTEENFLPGGGGTMPVTAGEWNEEFRRTRSLNWRFFQKSLRESQHLFKTKQKLVRAREIPASTDGTSPPTVREP